MPILEQYGAINTSKPIDFNAYQPVTTLSSVNGQAALNDNTQKLSNIENNISGTSQTSSPYTFNLLPTGKVDILENGKSIAQGGPGFDASYAQQFGYNPGGPVMQGSSPATQKMSSEINKAVSGGNLTQAEKDGLSNLQKVQDSLVSSAAAARSALESKDYSAMDFYTKRAEDLQKTFTQNLSDYYDQVRPLREQYAKALTPTDKEKQLQQQLTDVRSQADAFKLQTEQDKLAEYQGQTLGFAGGRAAELDFKASFKNQEYALKEKNLLSELGLEQDARKMASQSLEQQLSFIADDFDLQSKIQDKFLAIEDDLFTRADKLRGESKDTLLSILDQLQGVNPDELPQQLKTQISDIAARAGIPEDLVQEALKTQYQKLVFDQSMQRAQEARLSGASSEKSDDYSIARQFIADNPDASAEEIRATLVERTGLSATEINTLLASNGIIDEKVNLTGSESSVAIALVKSFGDAEKAKQYLDSGAPVKINGSNVQLSARQTEAIKAAIDEQYPSGQRTILQRILPGGK